MRKRHLSYLLLLLPNWALAQNPASEQGLPSERPAICSRPGSNAYRQLAQLDQGVYAAWWPEFMEYTSGGRTERWAAVMASKDPTVIRGYGNRFVNLSDNGRGRTKGAPGFFDGQWTKDRDSEPLFTVPNKWNEEKGGIQPGLTFFRHSEILANRRATPVFHDPSFGNHYHSFGVLKKGVDEQGRRFVIHRVMNDKWGASMKDYKAYVDASGRTISMEAMGPEINLTNGREDVDVPKTGPTDMADPNFHKSYYDLPMISVDGRFFAVNDRRTMTAKIFEITDDGKKREVLDLGFEAGKISFAPQRPGSNELQIAFHIDQIDPAEGDKMSSVHNRMTKDVVAMRLEVSRNSQGQTVLRRKEAVRVTTAAEAGEGNYYPKWINNHELIYIHGGTDYQQSFIKVDIDKLKDEEIALEAVGLGDCEDCGTGANLAAVVALGKMFADSCTNISDAISAREAQLYTLQLNAESCRELSKTWDQSKARVLSTDSLYKLRRPKSPGSQRPVEAPVLPTNETEEDSSGFFSPFATTTTLPRPTFNFRESSSRRGARRTEKAARRADVEKITQADLEAICEKLSPR